MGALSYEDNITLISPSIHGLNKMLSICAEFAKHIELLSTVLRRRRNDFFIETHDSIYTTHKHK